MPEILALPMADGLPDYLRWLDDATTPGWLAVQPQTETHWRPYSDVYPWGLHTVSGDIRIAQGFESPDSTIGGISSSTCRRRTGAPSGAIP